MRARRLQVFALWTVLGLGTSAQLYFAHQRFGAEPLTWGRALATGLVFWYLWGAAAPAAAWLGRRFQVDRASFGRHFFIHLGASLDIAFVHLVAVTLVQGALGAAFAPTLVDNFTFFYHWNVVIYWAVVAIVHAYDYHRVLEQRGLADGELERPLERLLVADDGRSVFLRTADVEWIEAARNYVRVHNGSRSYLVRMTLGSLEGRLDRERFRRVGRSALVNLDRVREIQPWFHGDAIVILESGAQVTLSRRYRDNLLGGTVPA